MEEYSNWLLNDSISSHFNAFKEGFDLVMGQNCLADLFQPDELEMMICGSNVSRSCSRGRLRKERTVGLLEKCGRWHVCSTLPCTIRIYGHCNVI